MQIKNLRKVNSDNSKIRAFFSVEWPEKMTINDCKLIEGKNGLFVAFPNREYEHKGQKKWSPVVTIDSEELRDKIQVAALSAFDAEK